MVEAGSQAKTKIKLMTHEFKHPKYYTELRKRNKSDQAISLRAHDGECERAPGSGLKPQASSSKPQAKPEPSSGSQGASHKPQAPSSKVQAPSHKRQAS
jgi:hypothetical protein